MKQITLPLPGVENMQSDSFVVGTCNRLALSLINAWPDKWRVGVCLVGDSGCGKTHLINMWRQASGAANLADAMRGYVAVDSNQHWFLDDVEKWLGNSATEEMLFHRINSITHSGGTVLVASRLPPSRLDFVIEDVRSRLLGFTVAEIGQPDEELLAAVLRKQLVDRQIRHDDDFIAYILKRTERSFAAVKRAAAELDEMSLERHKSVNIRLAAEWLKAS
jgi:chromosomal replication initiation ATPase DnaA